MGNPHPRLAGASPALIASPAAALTADLAATLGPFADLIGTWEGAAGWNLVAVPAGPTDDNFTLLIQQYRETITFTPMVDTPNRGGGSTSFIGGLEYSLQIFELGNDDVSLHEENGMWLFLGNESPPTIARQATVPHGDSVLAPGWYTDESGPPAYPTIVVRPVVYDALAGYTDAYSNRAVPAENQLVNDPASLLKAALPAGVQRTRTFRVDTAAYPSGGILNIPFIHKHADASKFDATMWLVSTSGTSADKPEMLLQYAQVTTIDFAQQRDKSGRLIRWPHLDINTLRKTG